ncbi:MAG: anti-sigma factor [Croceitalea sp.]|nr:anti-sigma factor [Croceitalea sp.]
MMDKKKILEEGLLEKYLLDELTAEESNLVETFLKNDFELKRQFEALETDFERMAFENAIAPPKTVKSKLQKKLGRGTKPWFRQSAFLVAASLAIIFLLSTFALLLQQREAIQNLRTLQNQTVDLQERLNVLENNYVLTNNQLQSINGPQTIPLVLYGNKLAPNSRAVAYVDHKKKMVMVNPQGLPKLPEDKTYQMWGDVDGEMINMGLLKPDEDLVSLKYIDRASSLNITIEPAGGNDHPTVEQLMAYVSF